MKNAVALPFAALAFAAVIAAGCSGTAYNAAVEHPSTVSGARR